MQIVEIWEREGYRRRMANNRDLTQQDGWMTEDNRMTKNVALEWERTVSRDIFSSFCSPEPSSRPVAYRVSNFIQSLRLLLVTHMLSAINTPGTDFISGYHVLEIVFTRAAPAFDNLFMGCVFNINTVHKTVEKLTFQAFYWSSQLSLNLLKKE